MRFKGREKTAYVRSKDIMNAQFSTSLREDKTKIVQNKATEG